ncbi:uncharacterized protein [Physcomitrium patens]|uniref:non-specific serine/threonine protein kinase n=2 Tax=Physcomitrium patens TaxID=3218 RepID=A0A2K1IPG4_PHYPA|nr:uncharacterized protein LOC112274682 isoform X2 [Physcomitrium patens]PNR31138.1 hypothetical protein PHYPA_027455 [Physcomitrium patens]|eukprot:XP_024360119.1 uncharacterized protein LOC112274682 isoform X2 [Physcomitrella patens]
MAMAVDFSICLAPAPVTTLRGVGRPEAAVVRRPGRNRSCRDTDKVIALPEFNYFGGFFFSPKQSFSSCNSRPSEVLRQASSGENSSDIAPERGDLLQDELLVERLPIGVIHNKGDVVTGKYTIIGLFGQGAMGVTFEAERSDGEVVALKAMSLRNMKGWKELDLFEREARVLKSLNHPGIPAYIDYFQVDTKDDRIFYIAQRAAKGKSLEDLITGGWRVSEEKVKDIAIEVLSVLQYLGDLRPPVIHRDIKPENIILDKETGDVKVVDFGAVQDVASSTLIGSTVVGTYGYMAPEQFQNRATLQTDLYGLGGTMLYMLSGRPPSYFPQRRLKVVFRDLVTMSPELANVIDRLLEPAPEDRFQSAGQVIQALQEESRESYLVSPGLSNNSARYVQQTSAVRRPAGAQVELKRSSNMLEVAIPAHGLTQETAESGAFTVAWNAFVAVWTRSAMAGGGPVFAAFSLPFWFVGLRLAKRTLFSTAVAIKLEFDGPNFSIEWSIGTMWKHKVVGETKNLRSIDVVEEKVQDPDQGYSKRLATSLVLYEGSNKHEFGSGLQPEELEWLLAEIKSHLQLPS